MSTSSILEPREIVEAKQPPDARDIRLLQMLADGETLLGSAKLLGLTYASGKNLAHRAYDRLGADNMTHAVALAMRRGFIQ